MVVGKRAELKKVPDAMVFELQSCAARDISGEKPENEMRPRLEFLEQIEHSGEQFAFASRQFERKKMNVAVQKRADVFIRRENVILLQYAHDDARIGHPRDFDAVQVIGNTEALLERGFESAHTSAA